MNTRAVYGPRKRTAISVPALVTRVRLKRVNFQVAENEYGYFEIGTDRHCRDKTRPSSSRALHMAMHHKSLIDNPVHYVAARRLYPFMATGRSQLGYN